MHHELRHHVTRNTKYDGSERLSWVVSVNLSKSCRGLEELEQPLVCTIVWSDVGSKTNADAASAGAAVSERIQCFCNQWNATERAHLGRIVRQVFGMCRILVAGTVQG